MPRLPSDLDCVSLEKQYQSFFTLKLSETKRAFNHANIARFTVTRVEQMERETAKVLERKKRWQIIPRLF